MFIWILYLVSEIRTQLCLVMKFENGFVFSLRGKLCYKVVSPLFFCIFHKFHCLAAAYSQCSLEYSLQFGNN